MRRIVNVVLAVVIAIGLVFTPSPKPAKADITYNYYIQFNVTDNSGIMRSNVPVVTGINITSLINQGYLNAQASDNNLLASDGTVVPYTVRDDNLNFVIPSLLGLETKTYYLYMQSTPLKTQYDIVTGVGGNITTPDAADLELGNNFTINYTGLVDTSAGVNKYLSSKSGSIVTNITGNGSITSTLFASTTPIIVSNATSSENSSASTTNHTFNIPTHNAGDLLIITISTTPVATTWTLPPGWASIITTTATADIRLLAWYKISDGTEGTVVYGQSSANNTMAAICYRITNGGIPTAAFGAFTGGPPVNPDPPSLNVSGNITGRLWLSGAAIFDASVGTSFNATSSPTNYTNMIVQQFIDAAGQIPVIATFNRTYLSTIDDPVAFTTNITSNGEYVAFTITVPGVDMSVTATSISTGVHNVTTTLNSSGLAILVDGVIQSSNSSTGAVVDTANDWQLLASNTTPYAENLTITVNGTQVLWYSPNAMISGTTLPNRQNSGTNDGSITWGTNSPNLVLSIGSIVNVLFRIPIVSNPKVFSNYITTGDLLFTAEIINVYPPYYPIQNPKDFFIVQLIASDNTTILAATPEQDWGDVPVGIYVNPTMAATLNHSATYYMRVQANFATRVTGQSTINTTDWKGSDLTQLDTWCVLTAQSMQSFNGGSGYTVKLTGGQTAITDVAGGWFTNGIAGIATVRPSLFTTSPQTPTFSQGTSNNTFDNGTWAANVGAGIANDAGVIASMFGKTGQDVIAGIFVLAMVGIVATGTMSMGGFGALGLFLITIPILWLGTWLKVIGVGWITLLTIGFGLLAIRQFWIKTT